MYHKLCYIYVSQAMLHLLFIKPYLSRFLACPFLYLLIGLSTMQWSSSIFEKPTQKISTLFPLHCGIRRGLEYRQAEQTKNGILSCSTWTSNYTRRTASFSVPNIYLSQYIFTHFKGLAPRFASPQPSHLHPKTKENQNIKPLYIFFFLVLVLVHDIAYLNISIVFREQ